LDKLASKTGHKTRASANTAYHKLKNKMSSYGNAEDADADVDADADAEDTPAPVVKKTRGKKAAVKAEEPETDEDDEAEPVTIKSKAKPKAKATKVAAVKPAKPAAKGRTTRASLKARKSITKDESSGDSDEAKEGLTLKTGRAKYPKIEDLKVVSTTSEAVDDVPAAASEVYCLLVY
jgi:acyl-CoA-binding protein